MADSHAARVLADRDWTSSRDLVELLLAAGCPTRNAAYLAVGHACRTGQITRRMVEGGAFEYKRNGLFTGNRPGRRAKLRQPNLETEAINYVGPVFDRGPLVPAIGAPDPEVMPPEVADIIDSLHQRFYREGVGTE